VSSFQQRNDRDKARDANKQRGQKPNRNKAVSSPEAAAKDWLWGVHAVEAALKNPSRPKPRRVVATESKARWLTDSFALKGIETAEPRDIDRLLPQGAVHQGVALKIDPPEPLSIEALGEPAQGLLVMLDQITDPQNVGAVFRSAAAFGARGIILQDRHAPALSGALAKAAVGAVDRLPHASAVNLSRALEKLAEMGWRAVGLDGGADQTLDQVLDGGPVILVMGSEGDGVRRLVAEHCDAMAKIAMPGGMESLNVSAAAAVALYEASRPR
jgi:23S rRNA (guanosine2251-2'-O)-methyltransferase